MIAKTNHGIFRINTAIAAQALALMAAAGWQVSTAADWQSNAVLTACDTGYDAACDDGLDEHGDSRQAYSRQPTAADKARIHATATAYSQSIKI